MKKIRLGLIGKDVSKSDSERIHGFILGRLGYGVEYERFSVSPEAFDGAVRTLLGDFDGFNITIPYKREVFEYLDGMEEEAVEYGSVNTVVSATRTGYNTDGKGFMQMLTFAGVSIKGKKVLILGAGGSGRSSAVALKKAGAEVFLYRRNRKELLETCTQLGVSPAEEIENGGYEILVNCTGVGMHDSVGKSPVSIFAFTGAEWAIDLIYRPEKSEFLRLGEQAGAKICNGQAMLFYQAYFADCLFLGLVPDEAQAKSLYEEYRKE